MEPGRELAPFGGVEVLLVHPVEQLHRGSHVLARLDDLGQVQPVALDDRPVRRHREHPVEDHVVGHEVDEDLRVDGDRVVLAVVLLVDAGDGGDALAPVHGEARDVLTELGAVADEVLRRIAFGELRQHLDELGVDRGAVVALHEVLDDELPVGVDVVGDALAHLEPVDSPQLDVVSGAEALGDRTDDRVFERRGLFCDAQPDVAQPLPQVDADQPELRAVDVRHLREVGR